MWVMRMIVGMKGVRRKDIGKIEYFHIVNRENENDVENKNFLRNKVENVKVENEKGEFTLYRSLCMK